MIENDPAGYAVALLAMTIAAYLTRAGGYWLIGRFSIGKRVQAMLDALPGAVIAASVVPVLFKGGLSGLLAVAAGMLVMIAVRNDFAAVVAGVAVVALARAAGL